MNRILFACILFLSFSVFAQIPKKLDSLVAITQKYVKEDTLKVRLLINLADAYQEVDLKKALEKANQAVTLAKRLNVPLILADAYAAQASVLMFSGDYTPSANTFNQAMNLYTSLGKTRDKVRMINNLGNLYYLSHDAQKAKIFYAKAMNEAEKMGDKQLQAKALCNLGNVYSVLGEHSQSVVFTKKGVQLFEQLGDKKSVARNISNLGTSYQFLGDTKQALDCYFVAKKMNESVGNNLDLANNLLNIGYNYSLLKDYNQTLQYFKQALAAYESIGNKNNMAVALNNIAGTYWDLGDISKCITYRLRVLALGKELQDNHFIVAPLMDLSAAHAELKAFDKAFDYFKQTRAYSDSTLRPSDQFTKNYGIARLLRISPDADLKANGYALRDRYVKAEEFLKIALNTCKQLNSKPNEKEILTELSLVYEKQGDFKKAYESYKKATIISKELESEENKKQLVRKEIQFEYDKKEADLKRYQEAVLKKAETQRLLLIGLLIVLILGATIIYLKQRQKILKQDKTNAMNFTKQLLENTEDERKRIASDLHDSISHELLDLKNSFRQDFSSVNKKIDSIINDIRGISRNLHPIMFDKTGLEANLEQFVERIQQQNDFMVSTEINYKGSLSSADELQIYRIIQEALSNIIKYAKAHAAKITMEEMNDNIFIEIKDNGKGFEVKETLNSGKSFGLHNIIERSRVVGGEAQIKSSEEGTVITINIPKKA